MKTSEPPQHTSHPDDMLLPYVEKLLPPGDMRTVEEHLLECSECANRVEGLRRAIAALKSHSKVFCPEPWELYEYIVHGEDPDGLVKHHVRSCESCRAICRSWSSRAGDEILPRHLWKTMRDRLPTSGEPIRPATSATSGLKSRFLRHFMFPSLALGAAAAAIMAVFLLLPHEISQSVVAPGSIVWENIPKPKALSGARHRAAVLISLTGFSSRWPEQQVNAGVPGDPTRYGSVRTIRPAFPESGRPHHTRQGRRTTEHTGRGVTPWERSRRCRGRGGINTIRGRGNDSGRNTRRCQDRRPHGACLGKAGCGRSTGIDGPAHGLRPAGCEPKVTIFPKLRLPSGETRDHGTRNVMSAVFPRTASHECRRESRTERGMALSARRNTRPHVRRIVPRNPEKSRFRVIVRSPVTGGSLRVGGASQDPGGLVLGIPGPPDALGADKVHEFFPSPSTHRTVGIQTIPAFSPDLLSIHGRMEA